MNNVPVQTTPAQKFQFDVFLAQVKGFLGLTETKKAEYEMAEPNIPVDITNASRKLDALRLTLEATPSVSTNEIQVDLERARFSYTQQVRKLEDETARVNAEADRVLAECRESGHKIAKIARSISKYVIIE